MRTRKKRELKVLIAHNRYEHRGGEDLVYENESKLLKDYDIKVIKYEKNNKVTSLFEKTHAVINFFYSFKTVNEIKKLIVEEKPDVIHVHNFHAIITPSIFKVAKKNNIKTVLTCHNYRIMCPTALLMHGNKINEKSIRNNPFWTVKKKVYKNSYIYTLALAIQIYFYRRINFWNKYIDVFICLTEFQKEKFTEFGIEKNKIEVKGNLTLMNSDNEINEYKREGYLFVGRLSKEKGIDILVSEWTSQETLYVLGDGPLKSELENKYENKKIVFLGSVESNEVMMHMNKVKATIMCSTWYEGFPMTMIESFSQGTPVVGPRIGSISEMIVEGKNGYIFDNIENLSSILKNNNLDINKETKEIYHEIYSSSENIKKLVKIYNKM